MTTFNASINNSNELELLFNTNNSRICFVFKERQYPKIIIFFLSILYKKKCSISLGLTSYKIQEPLSIITNSYFNFNLLHNSIEIHQNHHKTIFYVANNFKLRAFIIKLINMIINKFFLLDIKWPKIKERIWEWTQNSHSNNKSRLFEYFDYDNVVYILKLKHTKGFLGKIYNFSNKKINIFFLNKYQISSKYPIDKFYVIKIINDLHRYDKTIPNKFAFTNIPLYIENPTTYISTNYLKQFENVSEFSSIEHCDLIKEIYCDIITEKKILIIIISKKYFIPNEILMQIINYINIDEHQYFNKLFRYILKYI